uniref:glucan endo-1,3-beta-glucosidase, basic isoform-like n=1 Tax=Fragaria vesca subsp. vesca TaxID=101020 RepID=UPI0005C86F42|nr:PREDICTED: glucan endo-1,3-beta-glucosidase, basic isoform-like [Fragaria vesca subsp. vesca]
MNSLPNILKDEGYVTKVTTFVPSTALRSSYPPSSGDFTQEASSVMPDLLKFLASTLSPLRSMSYAQFTSDKPVIQNGNLKYYCLFDAIVDAFLAAMAKANNGHVRVLVSESEINTDGLSKGNPSLAGCGGVFKDNFGRFIGGYYQGLGTQIAFFAELMAVILGVEFAFHFGWHHIWLESDSTVTLQCLSSSSFVPPWPLRIA